MSNPYVGEIRIFAGNFAPAGWAFCNGQTMPISENETLFQLIGTTYGGDGQETFNLPNLQSRFPMHQGNGFTIGEMAGTEQETLTAQTTPVHSHPYIATTALADEATPGGNVFAQATTITVFIEDTPVSALAPQAMGATGGNQPHENMHPYLVINFIISLFGIFPNPN